MELLCDFSDLILCRLEANRGAYLKRVKNASESFRRRGHLAILVLGKAWLMNPDLRRECRLSHAHIFTGSTDQQRGVLQTLSICPT